MIAQTQSLPPDSATCLDCRYPLRGLASHACPECGRRFDPDDVTTMRVPGTPRTWERAVLRPFNWRHRWLRSLLIVLVVCSAWFPAPNPVPALVFAFVWLGVALPYYLRKLVRRYVVVRYELPRELLNVDRPDVRRVRRAFLLTFVTVVCQLPFFAGYSVSYPFLARTAWHWYAVAPASENPAPVPRLCGLMLVTRIDVSVPTRVVLHTPGGPIVFRPNANGTRMKGDFTPGRYY